MSAKKEKYLAGAGNRPVDNGPKGGRSRQKSRLVIVSNRIPFSFARQDGRLVATPSSGGLIGALEPLLKAHGGLWVGSAGTEDTPEIRNQLKKATREHAYRYAPIFLTEEEHTNYYEGFSNEVLWPLFHDLQSRCVFDPVYWDFYQRVNHRFADVVVAETGKDDFIWIQDYQLLLVASFLRKQRPRSCLAYFLHIPFPSPDIFEKLPWGREVLEGLLDYDLIGLQTKRDQRNLLACFRSLIPKVAIENGRERTTVTSSHGRTTIEAIPISIDYAEMTRDAATPVVSERVREIREQLPGQTIVLGVDRLDYTKGIPERLRGFRALLRDDPKLCNKVTLIQVVIPSREGIPRYQELLAEVEHLVATVNGEFSEPGWTPVHYIHRSVSHNELLSLYRVATVGLVTPLKDGMNLVAKEYCAAHIDDDGVLILSEFAGAMPELRTGAILVNPYDELGIAKALKQAIRMPKIDQARRMRRMRKQIGRADILHWRDRFFASLKPRAS
jgi:trehalose 6-phosphate synthase/phosphatase